MTPSLHVAEAARAFWDDASLPAVFPRDIRRVIARTLPISIVLLPELQVSQVQAWLQRQGRAVDVGSGDRPLRACLIAQSGVGIIFVNGGDQESEQRFSIAHELAHYLLDYLHPRQEAVARLGEGILEVLDGQRPARVEERTVALLTGVRARPHVHLLGREEEEYAAAEIDRAEARADALALELLAPWTDVIERVNTLGIGSEREAIAQLLTDRYGLPGDLARRYAAQFCPERQSSSALLRHLRSLPRPHPSSQVIPGSAGGLRR